MSAIGLEFGVRRPRRRLGRVPGGMQGPLVALITAAFALTTVTVVEPLVDRGGDVTSNSSAGAAAAAGSQVVQAGEVPAGLTAAEWGSIQDQIAASQAGAVSRAEAVEVVPAPVSSDRTPTIATDAAPVMTTAPRLTADRVEGTFLPGLAVVRASSGDVNLATASVGDVSLGDVPSRLVGDRVEYAHPGGITEWYRTTPAGLQQGFTLAQPATASSETIVTIGVSPGVPVLVGAQTIHIERPGLQPVVYRDLIAWDADDVPLPAEMSVVDGAIVLTVETAGATYPVTIDPIITEDFGINLFPNASGDQSGAAVAIDVDALVVASPFDDDDGDDVGKVEVYDYDVGTGTITFNQAWYPASGDEEYGASVDIESNIFVVGAPGDDGNGTDAGAVYTYTRSGPGQPWAGSGVLLACSAPGCNNALAGGGTPGDRFGESVALSDDGTKLVVGAPGANSGDGIVYVIDIGGGFTLDETLTGSNGNIGAFGASVDISADGLLIGVGAPLTDYSGVTDSGVAYVFTDTAGTYVETRELTPQTYSTELNGNFGASVAIENSVPTYLVATEPGGAGGFGTFFVHDIASIVSVGQNLSNVLQFGGVASSASAEGDFVVVGEPADGANGSVTILERTGTFTFSETVVNPTVAGGETGAAIGTSVSIGSNGSVAFGLPLYDHASVGTPSGPNQIDRGQTRVWDDVSLVSPTETSQLSSVSAAGDQFGNTVALDGDRMAVSAPWADEPLRNSGAVYIFERVGPGSPWSFVAIVRSPSPEIDGFFGESLDLLGDQLAVGEPDSLGDKAEPGRVWVFELQGLAWTQLGTEITPLGGGQVGNEFGYSVGFIDTDVLVIGSPGRSADAGGVWATAHNAGWDLPVQLTTGTPDPGDRVGHSVAGGSGSSATLAVAGAPGDDAQPGDNAGAIYIWEDIGSGFGAGTAFQKIDQTTGGWLDNDGVGSAVNTDGERIVAAGLGDYSSGQAFTGHAFEVQTFDSPNVWGHVWEFRGTLPVTLGRPVNDYVDISGGNIALGRPGQGGQVGTFLYDGVSWPSFPDDQLIPDLTVNGDRVGSTVAIEGRTLVTGASGDDPLGSPDEGSVFEVSGLEISHTLIDNSFGLDDPSTWDSDDVPGPGDTIVIPDGTGLVDVGSTLVVGRMYVGSGSTVEVLPGQTLVIGGIDSGEASTIAGSIENSSNTTLDITTDIDIPLGGSIVTLPGGVTNIDATSGSISITGEGTFDVQGILNKLGGSDAYFGSDLIYQSSSSAITDVLDGTVTYDGPVVEEGVLAVAANTGVEYWSDFSASPSTVIEIAIDSQIDWGSLFFNAMLAPDFAGATLTTTGSYTPVWPDTFVVIGCYDCGSPDLVYDIGLLQPTVAGTLADDSITLSAPPFIVVDTLADTVAVDGGCSLREAITAANTDAPVNECGTGIGSDTILFTVSGTIGLGSPLPQITDGVVIDGGGAITIDGGGVHSITSIAAATAVTLDGLVITDANTQSCPGTTCGAVVTSGDLTVIDSAFVGNTMSGNANGSAIANFGGTLTVEGSTFSGNTSSWAGPIWNESGIANVINSTFSGNVAQHAAIYNFVGATLNVWNSTFVGNDATSAVINTAGGGATTTIRNSIIANDGETNCQVAAGATLTVDAFNLAVDGTCGSATVTTPAGLDLAALADNGGLTETVAIGSTSAALGAGNPSVCSAAPVSGVDQRGVARESTGCDVGAFEVPTLVVNNTGDAGDASTADNVCETSPGNGICTLRAAIEQANGSAGLDRIHFDIPGGGLQTIAPSGPLPTLIGPVTIDGTTQPGASCATWPPTLQVELDATGMGFAGLSLANSATVRGLVINRFDGRAVTFSGAGNTLECNFLGTNATGTATLGEGATTLQVNGSNNSVGGPSPTQANLIAGETNRQVLLAGDGNVFQGNYFSSDPAGVQLPITGSFGRQEAFYVTGSNNVIGGTAPGEGNRIAGINEQAFDLVGGDGNSIRGNSIAGHFGLGIDISPGGVTVNDPLDADGGPNNTQNYPVLVAAEDLTGLTRVVGALDSTPSRTFEIDVFSNPVCDVLGNGEGETYLGTFSVTTDGSGNAPFSETLSSGATLGLAITTTATDMTTGDTSEFSSCFTATAPDPLIGYWSFDEASSGTGTGTVLDQTIGGNDGTINGGATYVPGVVGGGALSFDGVDDYVDIGVQPELDLTGGDYTIAFWVKSANVFGRILSMDDGSFPLDGYSIMNSSPGGCCRITHSNGSPNDTNLFESVPFDEWHHVAIVYNSNDSEILFFQDGVQDPAVYSLDNPGDLTSDGNDPLILGAINNNGPIIQFLDGALDELRIYNDNLTPLEIQALATTTLTRSEVNSTGDAPDIDPGDGYCQTATPGECTLRAALQETNALPGPDTITFNIPGPGPHVIQPLTDMTHLQDEVVIDGYSQPGASRNTLAVGSDAVLQIVLNGQGAPGGAAAGSDQWGLYVNTGGSGSTITGLVINGYTDPNWGEGIKVQYAENVTIEGNFIGTDATGTSAVPNRNGIRFDEQTGAYPGAHQVGGADPGERNVISGNISRGVWNDWWDGGKSNVIQGNYIGTNAAGTAAIANGVAGIDSKVTSAPVIGGSNPGEGNLISGNPTGIRGPSTPATIYGNLIGTDATGLLAIPNNYGIQVIGGGASPYLIGDAAPGARNVISGNILAGVLTDTTVWVRGNYIGVGIDGTTPLGNGGLGGVRINASGSRVGNQGVGDGNTIANNSVGVTIVGGIDNSVVGNNIYDNGGAGLTITGAGANDPGDPDVGANNLQNYPDFTATIDAAGDLIIDWSIDSTVVNSAYPIQIDVYEADTAFSGEGQTFLGRATILAPGADSLDLGNAVGLGVLSGDPVVATATDNNGNTSIFSPVVAATDPPVPGKLISEPGSESTDGEAGDLFGYSFAIDGDTLVVGAPEQAALAAPVGTVGNGGTGDLHIFDRVGTDWVYNRTIESPTAGAGTGQPFDRFGWSVDISGDWALVGARDANGPGDSSGRAFFIDLTTDTVTTIDPGDLDISSTFGAAVAIDGDVAVIGAQGRNGTAGTDAGKIYIYELVTGTWTLTGEFEGSVAGSQFGKSVDVDGLRVAAGTLLNTGTGFVNVYDKAGAWSLTDTITASGSSDQFGIEVALDADRLLIGAPGGDYVESHTFDGGSWNLEQTLTSSTLPGVDSFGYGLALDGPVALVGALRTDVGANTYQGAGFLFALSGGAWAETDVYLASDGDALDSFGSDVVIDGTTALLSAPTDDNSSGLDSGAIYSYEFVVPAPDGRIFAPDAAAGDYFGQSVDIHDDWMVVGARQGDGVAADSGSAYVFRRDASTGDWNFVTELEASDGASGDWFGQSVAIAGTPNDDDGDLGNFVIAVGAPGLASASTGAVYLYRYDPVLDDWIETEKIDTPAGTSEFGFSVDLEQSSSAFRNGTYTLVAGAPGVTLVGATGDAFVYSYRVTENPSFGDTLTSIGTADSPSPSTQGWHGISVAIDADTIVVGESHADVGGFNDAGRAHVYRFVTSPASVTFEATLDQPTADLAAGDNIGQQVSVDGDLAVVGSLFDSTAGASAGAAYVFRRSGTTWGSAIELVSAATGVDDNFGLQVRVEDGAIAVSSFAGGLDDAGTVQVFRLDPTLGWVPDPALTWEQGDNSTGMGAGLALSEDGTLAAGAAEADTVAGVDAGAVQTFDVDVVPPPNKLSDETDFARFGADVDVDGEWAIVGATGAGGGGEGSAYMFRLVAGEWQLFQELDDQFNPLGPGDDYGIAVAVGGSFAAISDQGDETSVYWFNGTAWQFAGDFFTPGFATNYFVDLDIDGANDRLAIGYSFPGAVTGQVDVYDLQSAGQPVLNLVIEPLVSTGTFYGRNVAIDGDRLFASAERDAANDGSVVVFERSGTTWTTVQTIAAPSGAAQFFGSALDVDGSSLIVGQVGGARAWVFEDAAGVWSNPVELAPGDAQAGRSVAVSGDIAVVGAPRATEDGLWAGAAAVYARAGSDWVSTDRVTAQDREFGDAFGASVAVSGTSLIVGAPYDTGLNALQGGAAHVFEVIAPESPTITFVLDVATAASVKVADNGIPVASFTAPVLEERASNTGSVAAVSLSEIALEDTPLAGIAVGETPLAGIVLESAPLAGIPLIDIDVDGGWDDLLDGTDLENVPLVDLTFGDALSYQDGAGDSVVLDRVQSLPLAGINVDGTPLAGIPLAGIALGTIPLAGIPLAGIGQNWCDIVVDIGVTCTDESTLTDITLMEATLRGVPLAGIPLAGIPLAGIDFAATPLAGIPLAGIEFRSTPLAGIPLAGIDVGGTPLAGIPLAGIPLAGIPLAGIPLAGIDVGGTPLAGIPLAGIPLAGIEVDGAPLAGIPLAGIQLEGAPLAGIPLAGIQLMDAPLAGIPLAGIGTENTAANEAAWCDLLSQLGAADACDASGSVGSTTLFEIATQGVPLAGIPLAGIPLAGIDLSAAPLAGIPLAGIPLAGIPLAGIPLAGIPLAGIELTGTPLAGIPLAGIPLAGIDVAGSPLAGIPLAGIDVAGSPLAGIPLAGIPLEGIPLAGIPLAGIDLTGTPLAGIGDLAGVPLAGIDVAGSPLAGIPLAGIELAGVPLAGIGVDCNAVNCDLDSLGDAIAAGAVDLSTTLAQLQPALDGLSLGDIAGSLDGLTVEQLSEVLTAANLTLADLLALDGMTLGDLPATDPALDRVTLGDLEQQLINVTFADLVGAILDPVTGRPIDSAALDASLRSAIDQLGLTVDDLAVRGEVTLGDLIAGDAGNLFLGDLGRILGLISVQSILDATNGTVNLPGDTLGDLTTDEFGEMTLADLVDTNEFGQLAADEFLTLLDGQGLLEGFDVGDLLLGLVDAAQLPFGDFDFTDVETGNLPVGTVADVGFVGSFSVGDTVNEQVVEVSLTLPTTAAYLPGSATLTASTGGIPTLTIDQEPMVDGNTLTWSIDDVMPGDDYDINFDVRPEIDLGSSVVNGSARIVGADAEATTFGAVQVLEGLEPNDFVDGVTTVADDTIYLTYISDATDIDVFAVTLQDNDVLAVELSNLAVDFDVALYVDPVADAAGAALSGDNGKAPVIPITDPDQNGADAEPLDDFTRLDELDPNLRLVEVSNARGLDNELIVTDLLPAGTYYVQVFGANGASSPTPAALQIQVDEAEVRPVCAAVAPITAPAGTTNTVTANSNTLFLINEQRLEAFHGAAGRDAVTDALLGDPGQGVEGLVPYLQANPQFGVDPAVVAVDGVGSVQAAYDIWNGLNDPEDACDPNAANGVVGAINSQIVDPIRDQLDYIVVIGGDEQIPMARLEDATSVANEYDYRHEFDGDLAGLDPFAANAFTSAFWERTYLSDEPYGETAAQSLGNRFLYVSDVALGRLVDTPDQIVRALDDFAVHQGSLDISSGAVLGYDFLVDGSQEIAAELAETQAISLDDTLADGIDDIADGGDGLPWDREDAEAKLGVVDPQDPAQNAFNNALISLNAHFDHYRALPAAGDKVPGFTDNLIASDVADLLGLDGLDQSLIFSMGCHSGLATPDSLIANTNDDWAERVAGIGGILIANTGFGYGDTEAVAYTEQLMALFAEQVTEPIEINGVPTTVGEALTYAKNQYIAELGTLSVYDEKALMESTFYGLPFYRTALPTAAAPPVPVNTPVPDSGGDPVVTYTVEPDNQQNITPSGTYYANLDDDGDELTIVAPGRPIQPADVLDVSVVEQGDTTELDQRARGALVLDMTSQWFLLPDPVVSTPIFDESGSQPEPELGEQTFPSKPVTINTHQTPSGERQSLVVATGQYRSATETQRLDSDIDVLVYYSAPGATDLTPPSIRSVSSTVENGQVTITATVTDGTGVDRVYVLLAEDPGGAATVNWRGLDLTNAGGGNQWSGSLLLTSGTTGVEFLVQAKDPTGNVGYATNKATNFSDDTTPPPPPPPTPDLDVEPDATNLDAPSGWYTGDVAIVVDSGDLDAEFSVDGAPFEPVPTGGSFVITGDGIHAWSVVTSNGQTQTGTVRIDTTGAPAIVLGTPAAGGTYEVASANLDLVCVDPSLTSCDISIDGVPFEVGDVLDQAPGSYVMTVSAVDVFGNQNTQTVPFTITGPVTAVPVIDLVDGPTTPQLISDGVFIDIEFDDDDGAFDDYTVVIDWGDGDLDEGIASTTCLATSATAQVGNPNCEIVAEPGTGAGIVAADFVYAEPGVYTITATVTDSAGNADTSTFEFAVVYDPGGGRVSGAGWYWSGNEAYDDGRPWGNLARFGYRAKYKNGDDVPSGKTKLHLVGEFLFKSVSYDYLIVNDTVAVAEGVGKLNGQTGYRFRVQGIDNGWLDFFQLSIWDDATGEIIYDNGVLYDEGDVVLLGGIRVRS